MVVAVLAFVAVDGSLGSHRATAAPGTCTFTGTDAADVLHGTDSDDVICGLKGDDVIYGLGGDDVIYGGAGNDVVHAGAGADRVFGGTGDNTLYGDTNASVEIEHLNGGPGKDKIFGGNGADDLNGDADTDTLSGGAGIDYVDYSCRKDGVTATLGGKANDAIAGRYDTLASDIENIIGGSGDDRLTGTSAANELNGGPGGDDVLAGLGGDDLLVGGYWEKEPSNCAYSPTNTLGDADLLQGGGGTDSVRYGSRTDPLTLVLGGGPVSGDAALREHDTISDDVEQLYGGAGDDRLIGDDADNYLHGGPGGDDVLEPRDGNDKANGGNGTNVFRAAGDPQYYDRIVCLAGDTVFKDPRDLKTC